MDYAVVSLRIAGDMTQAEEALNDALIAQSDLYGKLLKVRKETEASPFTGHQQLLRLMKAQQSLLSSSGDLARVHAGLLELQVEYAGIERCPESGDLQSVDAASSKVA
jgi:hypothetical protein